MAIVDVRYSLHKNIKESGVDLREESDAKPSYGKSLCKRRSLTLVRQAMKVEDYFLKVSVGAFSVFRHQSCRNVIHSDRAMCITVQTKEAQHEDILTSTCFVKSRPKK